MSAVDRAAEILDEMERAVIVAADLIPVGMTNGRVSALALADAGLLVTDEILAVLDTAVAYISGTDHLEDPEEIAERHVQLADAVYAHVAYLASRVTS